MKSKLLLLCLAACITCSSCATIFGGQKTDHQAHKPECGEPRRQIRVGAVIFDLLFPPALVIDFLTEKIYKPQPRKNKLKKCQTQSTEKE